MATKPTSIIDVPRENKNYWIFPVILITGLIMALLVFKWESVKTFFKTNPDTSVIAGTPVVTPPAPPAKVAVKSGEIIITQNCNSQPQQNHTLSKEQMQAAMSGSVTITQNCNNTKAPVVAHRPQNRHHHKPASVGASPVPAAALPKSAGSIWLWHHHEATAQTPQVCIVESGSGRGLPPYCNGFRLAASLPNETKDQWLVRVGGGHRPTDTGMYTKQ